MGRPRGVVHCSYHKCLTVLYRRVLRRVALVPGVGPASYHHFNSDLTAFLAQRTDLDVASVNNHALPDTLVATTRVSRFVRDPRDLVVSGYHYHRRGAEPWCHVVDPTEHDLAIVNGRVPNALRPGESIMTMLQRLDQAEGLRAEYELRHAHVASMREWRGEDDDVLVHRYEEILGAEREVFERLFDFYGYSRPVARLVGVVAARYSVSGQAKKGQHVRNPQPGQWRTQFDESLTRTFHAEFGDVIERLGYPR